MSTPPESPQNPPHGGFPPPPPPAGAGGSHAVPPPGANPPVPPPAGYQSPPPSGGYPPPNRASAYPPAPAGAPDGHLPGHAPGTPLSPSDQRLWAVLSHVLTLLVGFFAPLVIWLVFKGRGAFSEDHSRESLNFQITMTLAAIGLGMLTVVTLGLGGLLYIPFFVAVVVLVILASVKASQGEPYRYPLTYRFIT